MGESGQSPGSGARSRSEPLGEKTGCVADRNSRETLFVLLQCTAPRSYDLGYTLPS